MGIFYFFVGFLCGITMTIIYLLKEIDKKHKKETKEKENGGLNE